MRIIFISHLNIFCLFSLLLSCRGADEIFYFGISFMARTLLRYFKVAKNIKHYDFNISELRGDNGESSIKNIFGEDLLDLCDRIRKGLPQESRFVNAMGELFGREKISVFFMKTAAFGLKETVIFMNVIKWHKQKHFKNKTITIEFFVDRPHFFEEIKKFAFERYGLNLIPDFSLWAQLRIFRSNLMVLTNTVLSSAVNGFKLRGNAVSDRTKSRPRIGAAYRYYGATFDLTKRCDFPWLLKSDIPDAQVLVYFQDKHKRVPTAEDLVNITGRKDISFVATFKDKSIAKHMPIYRPTLTAAKEALRVSAKMFPFALKELLALRCSGLYYIGEALYFINQYARSFDFYLSNNIKVNVDRDYSDPYLIAEEIALQNTGGVSISYQESNWIFPQAIYASCADVVFLFGPHYYPIISRSNSCHDTAVFCGFLTDYSFKAVRQNSNKTRRGLLDNEAKFIVCYFDEKSSDSRTSYITNKKMEFIYRKLFEWAISNSQIGLIFSPKEPVTLPQRLSGISELMAKAVSTGRCVFMEGETRTRSWPAEAIQAADVVIASLEGGTTALESFLSGARTVYLDTLGLNSFVEYKLGRGKVVFDDIDELISAVEKYRGDKDGFDEFGNVLLVEDLIKQKDPFRDGKAAERMGCYLKSLLDSLSKGKSRLEAIDIANQEYVSLWSEKSLICSRNKFLEKKMDVECEYGKI